MGVFKGYLGSSSLYNEVWESGVYHTKDKAYRDKDGYYYFLGRNDDVMTVMPIGSKFESFGWNVIEIDGHDMEQILDAFAKARQCSGKPTVIVAETVKGKGVSFMEGQAGWHGKAPNDEQTEQALDELEAAKSALQ